MTTASSEMMPAGHTFERKVEEVKVSKNDINSVIMDYLINEGYPAAARKFAIEANLKTRNDEESDAYIAERVEIRNAIYSGEIQRAIEKINDLNPDLLDDSPALHFSLLRLQLIDLIQNQSNNDITPALTFAQTQLASRATTDPGFLEDLERTMALLIYPSDNVAAPIKDLLDPELRRKIAQDVNKALLRGFNRQPDAKLRDLIRLRAWAETKTRDSGRPIPSSMTFLETEDGTGNGARRNGHNGNSQGTSDGDAMQT